jgi:hypothetical protein
MEDLLSLDTYKKIKEYSLSEMAKLRDANHNDLHVNRVKNNALKIIRILNLESQVDLNLLKAICLLHDLPYTVKKTSLFLYIFEGSIAKRLVRKVLKNFNISKQNQRIIVDAISRHTHSFPFRKLNRKRDVYTKVLQDADTLDFFYCLRIKYYISQHDKGLFKGIRKKYSNKLINYGILNLNRFLNYPQLARSFFLGDSMKCV